MRVNPTEKRMMSLEDIKAFAKPYYGKEGFIQFFEKHLVLTDDLNDMVAKSDVHNACAKFCIEENLGPVPSINNIGLHLARLVTRRRGATSHQQYCFCGLKFINYSGTFTTLHPARRGRPKKAVTKRPRSKPRKTQKFDDDGKEDWEVKDWFRYGDGCLAKKKNKKLFLEKQKLRAEALEKQKQHKETLDQKKPEEDDKGSHPCVVKHSLPKKKHNFCKKAN